MLKSPLPARSRKTAGLAVVASLAAVCAGTAWASGATRTLITDPEWTSRPGPADIAAVYPPEAKAAGASGRATIVCRVAADGRLQGCHIASEDPFGFGQAALKLADRFQMKPRSKSGVATAGAEIRIPFRFAPPMS